MQEQVRPLSPGPGPLRGRGGSVDGVATCLPASASPNSFEIPLPEDSSLVSGVTFEQNARKSEQDAFIDDDGYLEQNRRQHAAGCGSRATSSCLRSAYASDGSVRSGDTCSATHVALHAPACTQTSTGCARKGSKWCPNDRRAALCVIISRFFGFTHSLYT